MSNVPERYFAVADAALHGTRPTWWGAVVADDRFPDLYDLNHAKISEDTADLALADVVGELEPTLRPGGSRHLQIVMLRADAAPGLVEEAVGTGLRSSDDTVMEFRGSAASDDGDRRVERADPGPELWEVLERSYREFDVTHPEVTEQLLRWNREVLAPRGRRYYLARRDGQVAGIGALQVAAGIGYVDDVVTFPEHRRMGVASSIVRRIVHDAAAAGADATFLLADEPGPIRLYRTLGFEETGAIRTLLGPAPWVSDSRA
jgi:N-acetylglutamate synthase-like GNAT family acetyltransferase